MEYLFIIFPTDNLKNDSSAKGNVTEQTTEYFVMLGKDSYNSNDFDRLIEDCNEAIRRDSHDASAYNNLGVAYFYKKDNKQAIDNFNNAILHSQNPVAAYYNRGFVYSGKWLNEQAIADFTKAIDSRQLDLPHLISAHFNRGLAYFHKSDKDSAIVDFEEALRLDPDHADAKQYLKDAK